MTKMHPTPPSKSLGATIRTAREAAGLSLEQLAEQAGTSTTLLRSIERGTHYPSSLMQNHLSRVIADRVSSRT